MKTTTGDITIHVDGRCLRDSADIVREELALSAVKRKIDILHWDPREDSRRRTEAAFASLREIALSKHRRGSIQAALALLRIAYPASG